MIQNYVDRLNERAQQQKLVGWNPDGTPDEKWVVINDDTFARVWDFTSKTYNFEEYALRGKGNLVVLPGAPLFVWRQKGTESYRREFIFDPRQQANVLTTASLGHRIDIDEKLFDARTSPEEANAVRSFQPTRSGGLRFMRF